MFSKSIIKKTSIYLGIYDPKGYAGVDHVSRGLMSTFSIDKVCQINRNNSRLGKVVASFHIALCVLFSYRRKEKYYVLDVNSHLIYYLPLILSIILSKLISKNLQIICIAHNIDSRLRSNYPEFFLSLYKRYEIFFFRSFDSVGLLSNYESNLLHKFSGIKTFVFFPHLFSNVRARKTNIGKKLTLGFIAPGSFEHNMIALSKIKKLAKENPDVNFILRCDLPEQLWTSNVSFLEGRNDKELGDFFDSIDVGYVPITSGAGVKIKVIEMLMRGLPVISTKHVLEGLPFVKSVKILDTDFNFKTFKENWTDRQLRREWLKETEEDRNTIMRYYK